MTSTLQLLYDVTDTTTGDVSVVTHNASADVIVPEECVVLQFGEFLPWDNPDNIISKDTEQMVDMLVTVIAVNVCFLISFPTNALNMVVFYQHGLKERINLCAFCQSLVDLLYMTVYFIYSLDRLRLDPRNTRGPLVKFFMNNNLLGFFALNNLSGFITALIAMERCLCVVSPLRSRQILKTRTTLVIIVSAFVFILTMGIISATKWHVTCVYNPLTNTMKTDLYPNSDFYLQNKAFVDFYVNYFYGLIYPTFFSVTVTVCTIVTVKKLRDMTKWREEASSAVMSSRDISLTRMLIGCSILFIVCFTPYALFQISWAIIPQFSIKGRYANLYNAVHKCVQVFAQINSSINFFIYYVLGSRFRQTLKSLCSRNDKVSKETPIISHPGISTKSP